MTFAYDLVGGHYRVVKLPLLDDLHSISIGTGNIARSVKDTANVSN